MREKKKLFGLEKWLSQSNVCSVSVRAEAGSAESTLKAEQLWKLLEIPELRSQGWKMPCQAGKPDSQNLQDLHPVRFLGSTNKSGNDGDT